MNRNSRDTQQLPLRVARPSKVTNLSLSLVKVTSRVAKNHLALCMWMWMWMCVCLGALFRSTKVQKVAERRLSDRKEDEESLSVSLRRSINRMMDERMNLLSSLSHSVSSHVQHLLGLCCCVKALFASRILLFPLFLSLSLSPDPSFLHLMRSRK